MARLPPAPPRVGLSPVFSDYDFGHCWPILAHNGLKIIARKNRAKCNPGLWDGLWLNETNLAMGAAQKRYDGQNYDENGYIKVSVFGPLLPILSQTRRVVENEHYDRGGC